MPETVIRARLYDGRTSAAVLTELKITRTDGRPYLAISVNDTESRVALSDVNLGDRVGDIPRWLNLSDGRSLEVWITASSTRRFKRSDP